MNLAVTIKSLYALNGFAAVLLYLPQIIKAWKDREHALSVSLISFGGWSIGSFVTALYAWLLVKDRMFTAVSIGNMAGSGAVFLIVVCSRIRGAHPVLPLHVADQGEGTWDGASSAGAQDTGMTPVLRCQRQGTKRTTLRVSLISSRRASRT